MFGGIVRFYEAVMRGALRHSFILALLCLGLVGASYACFTQLGSDLLPAFDEGGFILDYVMPAGTSLAETDRGLLVR